jgi:hypothetical protein
MRQTLDQILLMPRSLRALLRGRIAGLGQLLRRVTCAVRGHQWGQPVSILAMAEILKPELADAQVLPIGGQWSVGFGARVIGLVPVPYGTIRRCRRCREEHRFPEELQPPFHHMCRCAVTPPIAPLERSPEDEGEQLLT